MDKYNAVFLVGGPGSGKDFVLRTSLKESGATEIPLTKLITAIQANENLAEVDGSPLIVNGNADDSESVLLAKAVLETMGYETFLIHVFTTEETAFARSKIDEHKLKTRIKESAINMSATWPDAFGESWIIFNNDDDFTAVNEDTQHQIIHWLQELTEIVEGSFKKKKPTPIENQADTVHEDIDYLFEKTFPTVVDMIAQKKDKREGDKYKGGIAVPGNKATSREVVESSDKHTITFDARTAAYRVHKAGCPASKPSKHRAAIDHHGDAHSALQWCHDDESDKAGKPTKANAAICKCAKPVHESNQEVKVQQTQTKGVKYNKKNPAKGAKPPGGYFDSRIGTVPSGGVGLTAYHADETQPNQTLTQLREKKND